MYISEWGKILVESYVSKKKILDCGTKAAAATVARPVCCFLLPFPFGSRGRSGSSMATEL